MFCLGWKKALLDMEDRIMCRIKQLETKIMADLSDLDGGLNNLTAEVATDISNVQALIAAFQALQAKLPANPDYTKELDAVNAAITALQSQDTAVTTVDPPPAASAPSA